MAQIGDGARTGRSRSTLGVGHFLSFTYKFIRACRRRESVPASKANDVADYSAWTVRASSWMEPSVLSRVTSLVARRTLYIYSPIMPSVNNHRTARTHAARSRAGLRTMLTGLCARGKSWRQKYLPSGDVYMWEHSADSESTVYCRFCAASLRLLREYLDLIFHMVMISPLLRGH